MKQILMLLLVLLALPVVAQTSDPAPAAAPTETSVAPAAAPASAPDTVTHKGGKAEGRTSMDYLDARPVNGSRFGVSYFQLATMPTSDARDGNARLSTYNYLALAYLFPKRRTLTLKSVFYMNSAGPDHGRAAPSEVSSGDWYVEGAQGGLYLPADWRMRAALRVYAPTSQMSKTAGEITQLQPSFVFERHLPWLLTLDYYLKPSYFVQSKTAVVTDQGYTDGTKEYDLEHFVELELHLTPHFGVSQNIGSQHTWFHDSPANNVRGYRKQNLSLESGVFIEPSRNVFIKAALSNKPSFEDLQQEVNLYRYEDTQYLVMSSVIF